MKPSNKEFILRTIRVLGQYEDVKNQLDCSYSRTLFINCCVGLLLLSKEIAYKQLPNKKDNLLGWGISVDSIQKCKPHLTPKHVTRHLRNAISHGCFDFAVEKDQSIPINHISFEDYSLNGKPTFQALIPFDEFKTFVLRVSNEALKILDEQL